MICVHLSIFFRNNIRYYYCFYLPQCNFSFFLCHFSEFINLISSESNEVCSREEKKTIAPEHVLKALEVSDLTIFVYQVRMPLLPYDEYLMFIENLSILRIQLCLYSSY